MKISVHAQNDGDLRAKAVPVNGSSEIAFAATALGAKLLETAAEGSAAQRTIADHLLRNPVRVSALSIEDMANATGISPATISRFARTLGFRGYAELRNALADTLQNVLRPVEKLRDTFARGTQSAPLRESLEITLANLRATAEGLSPAMLEDVARRLEKADTVYVMGFGLSAHLAGMLTLGLEPFCRRLVNVVEYGGTENAAGRLMSLGPGDVLVALSFPRYSRDIIHLLRYAGDQGAYVVAITDSAASPLAQQANQALIAHCTHPVLSSSKAAGVLVVEALVTALMVSNEANVAKAGRLTDAISVYLDSGSPGPRGRSGA
jgi:DNA-binding MurR/RpiR family transcriptional regulator